MDIPKKIFKAYDIRGIYKKDITPESVAVIAKACAKLFKKGSVVVGYDGRHGSMDLAKVITKTLEGEGGFTVIEIGPSTTPMFYFSVCKSGSVGGMMITASHNPKEYSGIKIVGPNAEPISGLDVQKVVEN